MNEWNRAKQLDSAPGQGVGWAVTAAGGTRSHGRQAGAGVTVLMAPITLGDDVFFLYDAATTNPFWYSPPSPGDVLGGS
jgi:hypothetical protein